MRRTTQWAEQCLALRAARKSRGRCCREESGELAQAGHAYNLCELTDRGRIASVESSASPSVTAGSIVGSVHGRRNYWAAGWTDRPWRRGVSIAAAHRYIRVRGARSGDPEQGDEPDCRRLRAPLPQRHRAVRCCIFTFLNCADAAARECRRRMAGCRPRHTTLDARSAPRDRAALTRYHCRCHAHAHPRAVGPCPLPAQRRCADGGRYCCWLRELCSASRAASYSSPLSFFCSGSRSSSRAAYRLLSAYQLC